MLTEWEAWNEAVEGDSNYEEHRASGAYIAELERALTEAYRLLDRAHEHSAKSWDDHVELQRIAQRRKAAGG